LNEKLYHEEKLRGFLLGDLSEAERAAIEARFLADEDFSAQVHMVEDELIESYLRGELSAGDHQRFEAAFLTQPRRREHVLATKGLVAAANAEAALKAERSPSFWASLLAPLRFQSALTRYAVAAAVLFVLAFSALLLFSKLGPEQNGPLAQQTPGLIRPPATASVSPDSSPDISRPQQTPSPAVTPVIRASPSPKTEAQPAGPTVATVILRPTLVRDPSAANKVVVSSSVQRVRLQLNLERNDYRSYAVRITTVEGHLVWQAGSIDARTAGGATVLALSLPARLLASGDYIAEVSGVGDAGPPESLASYFFSITRK
jgi:hypothetical protein